MGQSAFVSWIGVQECLDVCSELCDGVLWPPLCWGRSRIRHVCMDACVYSHLSFFFP